MSDRPTVLYDEDGHPSCVSVEAAATPRQAARIAFTLAYEGAIEDYLCLSNLDGYEPHRPALSQYRAFVNETKREWLCPTSADGWNDVTEVWMPCKGVGLPGAVEFWRIPK